MLNCVRQEAQSGSIMDLAHVATLDMLADCLTKKSVQPDNLIKAVEKGELPQVDCYPLFRDTIQHKAFASDWIGMPQLAEVLIIFSELGLLTGSEPCLDAVAPTMGDSWKTINKGSTHMVVRVHKNPRSRKFKPRPDDPTLPVNFSMLSPYRETHREYLDGDISVGKDVWTGVGMDRGMDRLWIGQTVFYVDARPPGPAHGTF